MPFENLNSTPDPSEVITRYVFWKRHYLSQNARVNYKAWEPWSGDNQTSVARIVGLSDQDVWELGKQHVEPLRGRPILARADISVQSVTNIGLRVDPDEPPPRHANIAGWAEDTDAHMSKAQQLAAESVCKLLP